MVTISGDDDLTARSAAPSEARQLVEQVGDAGHVASLIDQIAGSIANGFADAPNLALIGIRSRGDDLARRLRINLMHRLNSVPQFGSLDITLYRDDFDSLSEQPIVGTTEISFSIDGRVIILVDDVLFTGRTVRAAMDELLDLGRPARIVLAVLVDRGWHELPIAADIVGQTLVTERDDNVQVLLQETDGTDEILLLHGDGDPGDG
ncbi:MAG: bifunctional pyr operon transcriptional regulator/uracil phosphoribosyltransferase PyrR [Chloroflexota bacterium]|nr:bifunctional pyr operon transcriptional regulator/uracil phosphoribosyltransferase PyrR [Chloroflexota bacterium]